MCASAPCSVISTTLPRLPEHFHHVFWRVLMFAPPITNCRTRLVLVSFCLLLLLTPRTAQAFQSTEPPAPPIVVFMTVFGTVGDSVAICKGVMYGIESNLRIVDLTHQVTPFSILDGARFLYGATPFYPAGTIFVVVIDPGVGTARKAVVVKSKRGQYFVLPDNGLITLVEQRDGIGGAHEIN